MRLKLLVLLPLVLVVAACQSGVTMWAGCAVPAGADPTGTDGRYVLVCRDGRWEPIMTNDEFVGMAQERPVTIAPLPAPPVTAPPVTAPPVTTPPVTAPPVTAPPVTIPAPLAFVSISAGANHTCGVTNRGGAMCWGDNSTGALGDGTLDDRSTPVDVTDLSSGVTSISAGLDHTCAVVAGAAQCWGSNADGRLGDGTGLDSWAPRQADGLTAGVTAVAAGSDHSCAIVSGAAMCWGANATGQLGDGTGVSADVPTQVTGLTTGVTAISTGTGYACAVVSGAAKCWGSNTQGELGNGSTADASAPVDVVGLGSGVTAISAGRELTCAVVDGAGKCWGAGGIGQLGIGQLAVNSALPLDVVGLSSGVTEMSAGWPHGCTVVSGAVKCWGFNGNGRLGIGFAGGAFYSPDDVTGIPAGATGLSASDGHTCAIVSGIAKCWGYNSSGQLGDGTTVDRDVPVDVLI
jgi:alpha-tubulin suppressor-like RCC1 family protein